MRGDSERQAQIMLAVTPETFVPADHPLRRIKPLVDACLARLSPRFDAMYAQRGRPSIPPEHLLKGSLLIALYSVRSERQFCEQLRYNLLFKWFLDLNVEDAPFNATTFSKNRARLLEADVARAFFAEVVDEAQRRRLTSAEHFSVDGTLLEAWASLKSYRPRDEQAPPPAAGGGRNAEVDFRGQRRRRETHVSRTDAEAQLYTKGSGQAAKLSYLGHALSENRHGLVVDVELTQADGTGERDAALTMLARSVRGRATLGGGPGLRHPRLRGGRARPRGDAARGPQRPRAAQRHRRAHDAASRLRAQPTAAEAGGGGLRLAQDRGRGPQAALRRPGAQSRLAGTHRRGIQLGAPRAAGARRRVGALRPLAPPAASGAAGGVGRGTRSARNRGADALAPPPGSANVARSPFFSSLLAAVGAVASPRLAGRATADPPQSSNRTPAIAMPLSPATA